MSIRVSSTHLTPSSSVSGVSISEIPREEMPAFCFTHLSGKRAKLFSILVEREVLDQNLRLHSRFSRWTFPPLTKEEYQCVKEEIEKRFFLELSDEYRSEVSIEDLFKSISDQFIHIKSLNLIGGYVKYLLFVKTGYAKRVFESLGLQDLYPSLASLNHHHPADIDIRVHIEGRDPSMNPLYKVDLLKIGHQAIASQFPKEKRDAVIPLIKNAASFFPVYTGINCFQSCTFKGSPVELILVYALSREYLFSSDLFVPIEDQSQPPSPQSYQQKPLESFLYSALGIIYTEDFDSLDRFSWLSFMLKIVKGDWSIQPDLEQYLYKRMCHTTHVDDPSRIEVFRTKIKRFCKKHFPSNRWGSFSFRFNICSHLQKRFQASQINTIWNQKIPFETFSAYLYICAHILHQQGRDGVEILGFENPAFHLRIKSSVVRLNGSLEKGALEQALSIIENSTENEELTKLFFMLCPSSTGIQPIPEAAPLLKSDSLLAKYIGFLFAQDRISILERHYLDFLSLPVDVKEFEELIGSHQSRESWITSLFDQGKEVAFEGLKEHDFDAGFVLKLIERMTHKRPHFALRLFYFIRTRCSPKECLTTILHCGKIVHQLTKREEEHQRLIEVLGEAIPQLFAHKDFIPPDDRRFLSQGIFWYIRELEDNALFDISLERKYLRQKETSLALTMQLDAEMKILKQDPTKEHFAQTFQCLKRIVKKEGLPAEKITEAILVLSELSQGLDVDIDVRFIAQQMVSDEGWSNESKRSVTLLIIKSLEEAEVIPSNKKSSYEKALSFLLPSIQDQITQRRLVHQCALKKLSVKGLEEIWLSTLHELGEEGNLNLMDVLLHEAEERDVLDAGVIDQFKLFLAQALSFSDVNRSVSIAKKLSTSSQQEYLELVNLLLESVELLPREKLSLIDTVPLLFQKDLLVTVIAVCLEMQNRSEYIKLVKWLLKTRFFDGLEVREGLQSLLFFTVKSFQDSSIPTNQVTLACRLIKRYLEDFRELPSQDWKKLFSNICSKAPQLCYSMFLEIERAKIDFDDINTSFQLFLNTVETLGFTKDRNLLKLVEKYEKYSPLSPHPSLGLVCCKSFIEGISHFITSDPRLSQHLDDFYHEAKVIQERAEISPIVQKLWGAIELTYVDSLFRSGRDIDGKNCLKQVLDQMHFSEYWQFAGPLVETLTRSPISPEYDELLRYIQIIRIPNLNYEKIITLLLAFPTLERMILVSQLWRQSMRLGWKPSRDNWRLYVQICDGLFSYKDNKRTLDEAERLIAASSSLFKGDQAQIGELYRTQSISLIFSFWAKTRREENNAKFIPYVEHEVRQLPVSIHLEDGRRLLYSLQKAIVAMSYADIGSFLTQVNRYWHLIVPMTKKTKSCKNLVVLQKEEFYSVKRSFIDEMKSVRESHPNPKLIEETIKTYERLLHSAVSSCSS